MDAGVVSGLLHLAAPRRVDLEKKLNI